MLRPADKFILVFLFLEQKRIFFLFCGKSYLDFLWAQLRQDLVRFRVNIRKILLQCREVFRSIAVLRLLKVFSLIIYTLLGNRGLVKLPWVQIRLGFDWPYRVYLVSERHLAKLKHLHFLMDCFVKIKFFRNVSGLL